jgi:CHAT domain-containing protein
MRVPGTARGTQVECDTLQTMRFGPLPAARTEANAIAKLWSSRAAGDHADDAKAIVLSGAAASERAFKTQAPAQRILHLATHGFFLGGACAATVDTSRRSVGGLVRVNDSPQMSRVPATTNPLILSGLALAGANQRARARGDEDDGVLTAEEVAGLDLSGVEWAVLSACDTGIGEVKSGEGVFGLRRALHVAGARTVIMSLWAVEDRATLDWMRALYDARFAKALDTLAPCTTPALRSCMPAAPKASVHSLFSGPASWPLATGAELELSVSAFRHLQCLRVRTESKRLEQVFGFFDYGQTV